MLIQETWTGYATRGFDMTGVWAAPGSDLAGFFYQAVFTADDGVVASAIVTVGGTSVAVPFDFASYVHGGSGPFGLGQWAFAQHVAPGINDFSTNAVISGLVPQDLTTPWAYNAAGDWAWAQTDFNGMAAGALAGATAYVDAVITGLSVVPLDPPAVLAVPEPATWLMLAIAFCATTLSRESLNPKSYPQRN